MEIPEKWLKFQYHFLAALILVLTIATLFLFATKFVPVLAYFWPLLLSTALFFLVVLAFRKTSALPATDSYVEKPGQGLLDYVAGQPDHPGALAALHKSD